MCAGEAEPMVYCIPQQAQTPTISRKSYRKSTAKETNRKTDLCCTYLPPAHPVSVDTQLMCHRSPTVGRPFVPQPQHEAVKFGEL